MVVILYEPVSVRNPLDAPAAVPDGAVAPLVLAAQPRHRPRLVLFAAHFVHILTWNVKYSDYQIAIYRRTSGTIVIRERLHYFKFASFMRYSTQFISPKVNFVSSLLNSCCLPRCRWPPRPPPCLPGSPRSRSRWGNCRR